MFVQIKTDENLYRDIKSGAILNTNKEEFENYYAERDRLIKEMQEKQALENKVNKLEDDISEIKNLLQQLVTRT